jgi:hypothetical protein
MTDIVSPTPVGNAPPAPLVTDTPAEFNTKAFSLAGWYQPLVTALNGVTANVFNNATAAQERATAAGQSAVQAGERRDEARSARDEARGARDEAQVWATSAVNAPGTSGTSTSSLVVAAGTKALVTQPGKAWVVGQPVVISRTSAPTAVQMWGTVSAYDAATGAMAVEVQGGGVLGAGAHTDWTIALVGRTGRSDLVASMSAATGILVLPWQRVFGANAGQITFLLPVSPALWDILSVSPCNGRYDNLVAFNGNKHMGISDATMTIDAKDMTVDLQWTGPDYGWKFV